MSHATMDAATAQLYKEQEAEYIRKGTFIHSSFAGSYNKTCVILEDLNDEFKIRYFDDNDGMYHTRFIPKKNVTLEVEQDELVYYVIKNKVTGGYHSAARSPSSAPQLYLTKGKAEARRKQFRAPDGHVAVKWTIKEEVA